MLDEIKDLERMLRALKESGADMDTLQNISIKNELIGNIICPIIEVKFNCKKRKNEHRDN